MSKIIKGIGKAVSGLFRGVKKVFKKVTSSKLGKAVLVAAAVYFGGAALGAWNAPGFGGAAAAGAPPASTSALAGADVAGTAVNAATQVVPGTGVSSGASGLISDGVSAVVGSTGTVPAAHSIAASQGAVGTASNAAKLGSAVFNSATAPSAVLSSVPAPSSGWLSRVISGIAEKGGALVDFASNPDNALVTSAGIGAISGALSPDEEDILELQAKLRAEEEQRVYDRHAANLNVDDIDLRLRRPRGATTDI